MGFVPMNGIRPAFDDETARARHQSISFIQPCLSTSLYPLLESNPLYLSSPRKKEREKIGDRRRVMEKKPRASEEVERK